MTRFILLLFLWSISVGLAASPVCPFVSQEEVLNSVKLSGLKCDKKSLEGCTFHECSGVIGTYPKPVLITIPGTVDSLRLHFHGHILGIPQTKPYEGSLEGMIHAFGIEKNLCTSSEVTVFPASTGKNTTYSEFFKDANSYTQFLGDIQKVLGNHLKDSPLHLSGHSGGGKYVAGALSAGIKTSKVTIFDGIYSSLTKNTIKDWYKNSDGQLTMATVKGMTPEQLSNELRAEVGSKWNSSRIEIKGTTYDMNQKGRLTHFSRQSGPAGATQAHFDVVSQIWGALNYSR